MTATPSMSVPDAPVPDAPEATLAAGPAAPGYRPGRTLRLRVELARQLARRRTQISMGLVVLLPVLLWIAFQLSRPGPASTSLTLVDLAKGSGPNFAVFALFASSNFLLVVVVALFFGDTVASEASWSSLRYLLAAPVPRMRPAAAGSRVARARPRPTPSAAAAASGAPGRPAGSAGWTRRPRWPLCHRRTTPPPRPAGSWTRRTAQTRRS